MVELALRKSYWANVSGGKDSLYMLGVLLSNPEKYPLDGVVHFELEIDYPFIKDVVEHMETVCKMHGIPFIRIKPETSWFELYDRYGFPTRKARWCNSAYKINAARQLDKFMKSRGFQVVSYIGYCYDEVKRYSKRKDNITEIYPLVQEQIEESTILEWAKNQDIFNNYYNYNKRCGCMYCPLATMREYAYIYKYYPHIFYDMISRMKKTEKEMGEKLGRQFAITQSNPKYNAEYIEKRVIEYWQFKIEKEVNKNV